MGTDTATAAAGKWPKLNVHKRRNCICLVESGFPRSPTGQMPQLTMMNPHWRQFWALPCVEKWLMNRVSPEASQNWLTPRHSADRNTLLPEELNYLLPFWTHKVIIFKKLYGQCPQWVYFTGSPRPAPWSPPIPHSAWHLASLFHHSIHKGSKRNTLKTDPSA